MDEILQKFENGIILEDILKPEFINALKENFEEYSIKPINLVISVENTGDLPRKLSLFHRTPKQIDAKKLIVDVDEPKDLEKLLLAIKEVKNEK